MLKKKKISLNTSKNYYLERIGVLSLIYTIIFVRQLRNALLQENENAKRRNGNE